MRSDPACRQPATDFFLDKEGRWFHEGCEITHARTLRLFSRSLTRDVDGRYWIEIGAERARVEVEDTAYQVRSVTVIRTSAGIPFDYVLHLSDGVEELLDPATLAVGKRNVLYCSVRNGSERARFLRQAYYQLCECFECGDEDRSYWVPWRGQKMTLFGDEDPLVEAK
ncbi:MAG: DUF1285 domain-containing protein [Acidobacteriota bacterium]